jgi:putative ABC transport system substrate-binding protein
LSLIATYASSQNNLTGITNYAGPLSGKRMEILRDIVPGIKRVLTLMAPQELVATVSFQFLAEAAPKLSIEVLRRDLDSKEEIAHTPDAIPKGAVDAIYFVPSTLVGTHIARLIHKAREDKIPLAVIEQPMVEQGALMSFGADMRLVGVQAAKLMAKVLEGAKPSEMPIQMPDRLPLALNLTTARAIELDIPANILERIDRIME